MSSNRKSLWTAYFLIVNYSVFVSSVIILEYEIDEEGGPNVAIGNVARDAKLSAIINNTEEFQKLRYSFLDQSHPETFRFSLNESSSDLKTKENLDREIICEFQSTCEISLEIAAQSSLGVFFQKILIQIHLLDINDNPPTFQKSSEDLAISESSLVGSKFTIEGAIDKDSQNNSIQTYEILPANSPFSVKFTENLDGSSDVKLVITEELDREKKDSYGIQVLAKDGGTPMRTGNLFVNITITDTNDNSPEFTQPNYNVTIKEDIAVNSTILTLRALDKDKGKNGEILYKISTNQLETVQRLFRINADTGELQIIKQLIYEPSETYKLIVEAYDKGDQPLMTQTVVNVHVQDSGNNRPEIKINLLSSNDKARISEYANMGAVVAHIKVVDNDRGANGVVTCNISGNQFQLQRMDVNEYKVIVQLQLDREVKDEHYVTVSCGDVGNPPLNNNASFVVQVTDENDKEPNFTQDQYEGRIMEDNSVNDFVLQVEADDLDLGENGRVSYRLHGDAGNDFIIESATGKIRANRIFDRETKPEYRFNVYAVDNGDIPQSSYATVTVYIDDKNDNFPKFTQDHYISDVQENLPIGAFVMKVTATDLDAGDNGIVTFELPQNSDVPFFVEPSGVITTTKKLDREKLNKYTFSVIASDHGNSPNKNSVSVTVDVLDDNDNQPIIVYPNASNDTVFVSYLASINTLVMQVQAYDIDAGENKSLVYSINERNDSEIFNINSRTGEVIVARQLESNLMNRYFLRIAVSDQGPIPLTSRETLHLVVALKNSTDSDSPKASDDSDLNIAIVITVIVVTLVLSATIIITIFVIRRLDQQKRKYAQEVVANGPKPGGKPVAEVFMNKEGLHHYSAPGERVGMCYNANDTSHDRISVNSQSTFQITHSTLDMKTPGHSDTEPLKMIELPGEEARHSQLNRIASIRLHQKLLQSSDKPWSAAGHETFSKERPDNHSDTSGETIPSDSGRGGSEDEIHSNSLSHSHNIDDMRGFSFPVAPPIQAGRRGVPPHSKPPFRDDHVYSNHPINNRLSNKDRPIRMKNHPNILHHYTDKSPTYANVTPSDQVSADQIDLSHHLPPHVRTFYQPRSMHVSDIPEPTSYTTFQRGIMHQPMDDTLDSVATGYDDDDNTTTSGSYTIDAEELPLEVRMQKVPDVFV
ncbi:hypothetical protein FSP39_000225 [Pinctada imbricata]|uniref:Cadherin domain-containing protein n=1 Tax=Pinctada imbricata TaxID=66713 RepID=A0AA89BYF1_PINIB|nr:hypothetical protein FSP39_000225 [Pinctada imbricata]